MLCLIYIKGLIDVILMLLGLASVELKRTFFAFFVNKDVQSLLEVVNHLTVIDFEIIDILSQLLLIVFKPSDLINKTSYFLKLDFDCLQKKFFFQRLTCSHYFIW